MDYKLSDFKNDYKEEEDYFDREDELAFAHTLYCASQGEIQSMRLLGFIYSSNGYGVVRDFSKAVFWYRKAADCGDLRSVELLADIYYCRDEDGFPHNYEKAFGLYQLASEDGSDHGTARLGIMYLYGLGCERDLAAARALLKKAADEYEREACYEYALILKDEGDEKWLDYLKEAVEQNYGRACFEMINSFGDSLSDKEYVRYLVSAAHDFLPNYDPSEAQFMCGECFMYGTRAKKNYDYAKSYYLNAAESGNKAALKRLGDLYFNGYGVEQSYEKAEELYRGAAFYYEVWCDGGYDGEGFDLSANMALGDMYFNGTGVEKDLQRAFEFYHDAGYGKFYAPAQSAMANCYYNGWGVEKDIEKAEYWWKEAAQKGDESAKEALKKYFNIV